MAEHCGFGPTLTEHLRDQLVPGIRSISTQKKLLAEPDLPLARAIEKATAGSCRQASYAFARPRRVTDVPTPASE